MTDLSQSVRKSIALQLIRHGESHNNEIYGTAHKKFGWGTPDFDEAGWVNYVDTHRKADPGLSQIGRRQSEVLGEYLQKKLTKVSSKPYHFVVSPMKRAIDTILPTLKLLNDFHNKTNSNKSLDLCQVIIHGWYHEAEGCHLKGKPEPGMNQLEILEYFEFEAGVNARSIQFVGFPDVDVTKGWFAHGTGPESRVEVEERVSKFYLWLCEHLDEFLFKKANEEDIYDAGVVTNNNINSGRRTVSFVGHGEFMGHIIKKIVSGYGHSVEHEGVPHRSTFVHYNTAITELEYFGAGRTLVMGVNKTPHLDIHEFEDNRSIKTGGRLKDGWSYIVPEDRHILQKGVVTMGFADELDDHIWEQIETIKSLYLSPPPQPPSSSSSVEELNFRQRRSIKRNKSFLDDTEAINYADRGGECISFAVKRGQEVLGCASFNQQTGRLSDVVVRPSARRSQVGKELIDAVKKYTMINHCYQNNSNDKLPIRTVVESQESKQFFEKQGFVVFVDDEDGGGDCNNDVGANHILMEYKYF